MESAPAAPSAMALEQSMPVQAVIQTSEYSAEFRVPGLVTLKSINDSTKMFIAASSMKAELLAQTTPRLLPQAFLFAKITNGEEYPFIPGTVSKYRDGAFIGNSALSMLRPKETTSLSFGVDDRIKVIYQRKRETQDNPTLLVVGDIKVEREYETRITNLHKDPVGISIFEQYPVSNDPDVRVDMINDETTPGYVKDPDNRQGVVVWETSCKSREEKIFDMSFRVKFPKGKQINGL